MDWQPLPAMNMVPLSFKSWQKIEAVSYMHKLANFHTGRGSFSCNMNKEHSVFLVGRTVQLNTGKTGKQPFTISV